MRALSVVLAIFLLGVYAIIIFHKNPQAQPEKRFNRQSQRL